MIAIIDYGAGNLVSVKKALDWLGQQCAITSSPLDVQRSSKIVLPGVGHFSSTSLLARSGLRESVIEAIDRNVPFLGICVGMQWMFCGSEEAPERPYVYFTHSYFAPVNGSTVACCDYGGTFSAAIERDLLFGVQFHPEKSGEAGLRLLANFAAI